MFLPAAGYCFGGNVSGQGDSGRYWSSMPNGSDYAYYLNFGSSYQRVESIYRYYGYSVRPVLNESAE